MFVVLVHDKFRRKESQYSAVDKTLAELEVVSHSLER